MLRVSVSHTTLRFVWKDGRKNGGDEVMVWGWEGWIAMAVWIGALLVMVWLITRSGRPAEDAMSILRARFARGEIGREEFEQARAVLLRDR